MPQECSTVEPAVSLLLVGHGSGCGFQEIGVASGSEEERETQEGVDDSKGEMRRGTGLARRCSKSERRVMLGSFARFFESCQCLLREFSKFR